MVTFEQTEEGKNRPQCYDKAAGLREDTEHTAVLVKLKATSDWQRSPS